MARCLMAVLALVATVAHAQDSSKAVEETKLAVLPESGGRRDVLASRPTPSPGPSSLAPSAGSLSGGADTGALRGQGIAHRVTGGCSVVDVYLADAEPKVRTYQEPPLAPEGAQNNLWELAPYVKSVTHCGPLYIFKVVSWSEKPWIINHARVEGPKGAALRVNDVLFGKLRDGIVINVIIVEVPAGVTIPNITLHLIGEDGRVAQPTAEDLP